MTEQIYIGPVVVAVELLADKLAPVVSAAEAEAEDRLVELEVVVL